MCTTDEAHAYVHTCTCTHMHTHTDAHIIINLQKKVGTIYKHMKGTVTSRYIHTTGNYAITDSENLHVLVQ